MSDPIHEAQERGSDFLDAMKREAFTAGERAMAEARRLDERTLMEPLRRENVALRASLDECGYTGSLPEGEWDRLHAHIEKLPSASGTKNGQECST